MLLVIFFYGPAIASLVIAIVALKHLFVASRDQSVHPHAWPAVIGATVPQLVPYAIYLGGISFLAAPPPMYLIWIVASLFAVFGLVAPPAPARRWMFGWGFGSTALGCCWLYLFSHASFGH